MEHDQAEQKKTERKKEGKKERILPPPALFILFIPNTVVSIKATTRTNTRLVTIHFTSVCTAAINNIKMRSATLLAFFAALVCLASSFPQKAGQVFSDEAVRQAQNTYLIPKDATIQNVQEGIELGAYESIPANQKINLAEILADFAPPEVLSNIQGQIDQIGRN